MKLLGIDFGTKRIGLALTDPEARLAFPLKTIARSTREKDFAALLDLIRENEIEAVVIGLPDCDPEPDGSDPLIVRQIRNFAASLGRRTDLPIHFADESFSSYQAEADLRAQGVGGERLKEVLDQQAAVRILNTFMSACLKRDDINA